MTNKAVGNYIARIGGIIYKNVEDPIIFNGASLLGLTRNTSDGELGVNLDLKDESGNKIAAITDGNVSEIDSEKYTIIEGQDRFAVVEKASGRTWADIRRRISDEIYELDVSCLFIRAGFPVILHPNRTKIGKVNDNQPPNISSLTLSTQNPGTGVAIHLKSNPLYIIDVAIEYFKTGITIEIQEKP
jgi:hypothetical protein